MLYKLFANITGEEDFFMWIKNININEISEIRSRTTAYLGVGAITKIDYICSKLKERGVNKVIILTGKGAYKSTGAWDHVEAALKKNGIEYLLYNKVTPNPTVDEVDEAIKQGIEFGAQASIGIGGGSSIDASKTVAILLAYPDKNARDVYEFKFTPEKAVPIVAINLTHGTGTEVDRFAVVSIPEKNFKPAIAYDCIYPAYAIDDPQLMVGLPKNQTIYVSVDAVNHVVEAATSKVRSPYTVLMAKETVNLVAKYLPIAEKDPGNLEARYYLLYASMIAGICFDNGLLHYTHALEHPLSGVKKDITHGLGLAILLPAVIKQIYPAVPQIMAEILSPIASELKGTADEAEKAGNMVEKWLNSVGITEKLSDLGFKEEDVDKLVNLAFNTPSLGSLLGVAPVEATKERVRQIYSDSL